MCANVKTRVDFTILKRCCQDGTCNRLCAQARFPLANVHLITWDLHIARRRDIKHQIRMCHLKNSDVKCNNVDFVNSCFKIAQSVDICVQRIERALNEKALRNIVHCDENDLFVKFWLFKNGFTSSSK
jgi:hypothetical protein